MSEILTSIVSARNQLQISIKDEARDEAVRQVNRIAETMSHMRVSPAEVAKVTGLSRQTVYRVLNGSPAKLETVIAIDRAVSGIVHSRMQAVALIVGDSSELAKVVGA